MNNKVLTKSIDFIARACLASVFVRAIPGKITDFSSVVATIAAKGIPEPLAFVLLIAAIACLLLGSIFMLFGRNQQLGAALLLIFLVPTTMIFHLFPFQAGAIFMNLGLIGGLTLVVTRPMFNQSEQPT